MIAPHAYYNDSDPSAAEWTRNLIAAGLVPHGEVDERSIRDVRPEDVAGPGQRHFFAGIAGWAYACRLAGIPDDASIWTGSPPCQPLSVAGRRQGHADERHLWPAFYRLIAECRPVCIVGEQVGGALGYEWLAGVQADMEAAGFAFGAADLPACGVGAPHIRSRLFWCGVRLADPESIGRAGRNGKPGRWPEIELERCDGRSTGHANRAGLAEWGSERGNARPEREAAERADGGGMEYAAGERRGAWRSAPGIRGQRPAIAGADAWGDAEWLACHDGRARRAKPGLSLLVAGLPGRVAVSRAGETGPVALQDPQARQINRVAAWRGFGNAIVPQIGATFLRAFLDAVAQQPR